MSRYKVKAAATRADVFVASKKSNLTRSFILKLFKQGKITVNRNYVKPGARLKIGDTIAIDFNETSHKELPKLDIDIIYEDDDCIVINKPTGMLSHSKGALNLEPSVASIISDKIDKSLIGNRAGIVHRLDRGTSGIMICAKTLEAQKWLQKQFSTREVEKQYRAIVSGHLDQREAIIEIPITRNPKVPTKFKVSPHGKNAVTQYRIDKESSKYSLVSLFPLTGRTHQLRVHLNHIGHPIVGDYIYDGTPADRLYLHAETLSLALPNRTHCTFTANLPTKFRVFIEQDNE